MERLHLRYKIEKKEYLICNFIATYKQRAILKMVLIGLLLLGVWSFVVLNSNLSEYPVVGFAFLIGIALVFALPFAIVWLGTISYRTSPKLNEIFTVTIDNESVRVIGQSFEYAVDKSTIHKIQKNHGTYCLFFGSGTSGLIIPLRSLEEGDLEKLKYYFQDIWDK